MVVSDDAAKQSRGLLRDSHDHDNRRSDEGSSDFDFEDDRHYDDSNGAYPKSSRRRRRTNGWNFSVGRLQIQCPPQLNRRHKLLVFALTILILLVGCAAVYGRQRGIPFPGKKEEPPPPKPDEKPPPPPKPTFCSTWPVNKQEDTIAKKSLTDRRWGSDKWKKPKGFKIVATVFYGRRRNVDILDCYLQRNLVRNGGYLDSVHFMVHTDDEPDRAWIEQKANETEGYEYIDLGDCTHQPYGCMWDYIADADTLYIKIDDDIV